MKTVVSHHTVKIGHKTLEMTTVADDETNIETTTVNMTQRKKTVQHIIEKDMATGKLLPPKLPEATRGTLLENLIQEMSAAVDEMVLRL